MGVFEFYFSGFFGIIFFILSLAFYFLPTIIALLRGHRNALAIFLQLLSGVDLHRLGGGSGLVSNEVMKINKN